MEKPTVAIDGPLAGIYQALLKQLSPTGMVVTFATDNLHLRLEDSSISDSEIQLFLESTFDGRQLDCLTVITVTLPEHLRPRSAAKADRVVGRWAPSKFYTYSMEQVGSTWVLNYQLVMPDGELLFSSRR